MAYYNDIAPWPGTFRGGREIGYLFRVYLWVNICFAAQRINKAARWSSLGLSNDKGKFRRVSSPLRCCIYLPSTLFSINSPFFAFQYILVKFQLNIIICSSGCSRCDNSLCRFFVRYCSTSMPYRDFFSCWYTLVTSKLDCSMFSLVIASRLSTKSGSNQESAWRRESRILNSFPLFDYISQSRIVDCNKLVPILLISLGHWCFPR